MWVTWSASANQKPVFSEIQKIRGIAAQKFLSINLSLYKTEIRQQWSLNNVRSHTAHLSWVIIIIIQKLKLAWDQASETIHIIIKPKTSATPRLSNDHYKEGAVGMRRSNWDPCPRQFLFLDRTQARCGSRVAKKIAGFLPIITGSSSQCVQG